MTKDNTKSEWLLISMFAEFVPVGVCEYSTSQYVKFKDTATFKSSSFQESLLELLALTPEAKALIDELGEREYEEYDNDDYADFVHLYNTDFYEENLDIINKLEKLAKDSH